jgi:hypothetical protein
MPTQNQDPQCDCQEECQCQKSDSPYGKPYVSTSTQQLPIQGTQLDLFDHSDMD